MPFADVDGFRVYYEEHGEGDPLLLLSDLGADCTAWQHQIEDFRRQYRVIVLDNPGSGRTGGAGGPYTISLFADAAAGTLRHLGVEQAHVIGSSMGSAIAQELALRHPGLARSLALHGAWGQADGYLVALMRSWQATARAVPRLDLWRQIWLSVFTVWVYNDRPDAIAELERRVLEDPSPQSPQAFCAQAEACIAHDALDRLTEIEAPTLITVGDRDTVTPAHHAYAIKERMPLARVRVWQKMGHAAFWEAPDEFNAISGEFLAAH